MAPNGSIHLTFLLLAMFIIATARAARPAPSSEDFIKASCGRTKFPTLCFTTLSSYSSTIQTSPTQLANTALSVCLSGAKSTSTTMENMCSGHPKMRPIEVQVMKDCIVNVHSSIDELRRSVAEMNHIGGQELTFQINNVQTWVSAALTDENTCMDGFAGRSMDGPLKTKVRSHILSLGQLTSNALSLVNALVSTQSVTP